MSIFELLFGFQGRISRAQWWLGQVTAAGLAAIFYTIWSGWIARYGLTSDVFKSSTPSTQITFLSSMLIVGIMISSTLVWVLFSLAIKRVHDRDHSGLWAFAFGLPLLFAILFPSSATKAFAGASIIWYFLELGTLQGSPSINAHGAPVMSAGNDGEHVDPMDLSLEQNIERAFAGRRPSSAPAGLDDYEIGTWANQNRPTRFGRRASG